MMIERTALSRGTGPDPVFIRRYAPKTVEGPERNVMRLTWKELARNSRSAEESAYHGMIREPLHVLK